MKRIFAFCMLIVLVTVLCGCSSQPKPVSAPAQNTATAQPAFSFDTSHPLGEAASVLLSPYEKCLLNIDIQGVPSISHRIPEEMFALLVDNAAARNAVPAGGKYTFSAVQTSTHTYQATAMEATAGLVPNATPAPGEETPMDSTKMGDYTVSGGGVYHRTYLWDVQEDLSRGTVEIITTLNGESTGHETFAFAKRSDGFYFVDAAKDLMVNLDTLQDSGTFLVAVGKMTQQQIEVVEYHVSGLHEVPQPENLDFDWLKNTTDRLSYLCATPDTVTFQ